MLIRKNTKAYKTILEIVESCQGRADREKLIRLYITRAGHTINDRISIEGIQGDAALFYEMNYQVVLNNLGSSNHQLHVSDETPGIYFFHTSSNKTWDEAPFEFDESIKKHFETLPELPILRKKEKAEKFSLPTPKLTSDPPASRKEKAPPKKEVSKPVKEPKKKIHYKLKYEIEFSDLDRIVFRQHQISKKDILDYYDKAAEYIIPFLKDRPLWARRYVDDTRTPVEMSLEGLFENDVEKLPDWIQTATVSKGREHRQLLLCNDKEHLMFYVENGCIEFNASLSKIKTRQSPDCMVIVIDSPDADPAKAIDAANAMNEILTGLQLPAFIKIGGLSELHIYLPLDSKNDYQSARDAAEFLCKLLRLKAPELVSLAGTDDYSYGKVVLDYSSNEEGQAIVAPYCFIAGQSPVIAAPVTWNEVTDELHPANFDPQSILKRFRQISDPFSTLFRKKVNARLLVERLEDGYSFLF